MQLYILLKCITKVVSFSRKMGHSFKFHLYPRKKFQLLFFFNKKHHGTVQVRNSQVVLVVKKLSANAGEVREVGSTLGSGRFPRGGHGNPPQYSCLENPMDRGAWWATVHRITKRQTQQVTEHSHKHSSSSITTISCEQSETPSGKC